MSKINPTGQLSKGWLALTLGQRKALISGQLVCKFGNIFTQILSGSIVVLDSEVLPETEVKKYRTENSELNFNPG